MFLEKTRHRFGKVSYRLAAAYMLFFIPCYLLTFGSFYYLTERYLKNRDRDLIDSKIQFYQSLYEKDGVQGLKRLFDNPRASQSSHRYFIQVTSESGSADGKPVFLHIPEDDALDPATIEKLKVDAVTAKTDSWVFIPPVGKDDDSMEIKTVSLGTNGRLSVGASTDDREDLLEIFQKFFVGILFPLVLVSLAGSIYISQRVLKPLRVLAETIKHIQSGALSARAQVPKFKDELYHLSTAFNEMVHQIETLIEAMKETLDNIAHDLKTPLTRSRIAAELALQTDDMAELKAAVAESVENTDSILKVVDTVMTVAQLNSKALSLKKESFDARNLIEEVLDLYLFVAEEKNIQIELKCESTKFTADRIRVKQIIANLLDNAIKYSAHNSNIWISCRESGGKTIFAMRDEGIGISSSETNKIWERLYRGDKSRHEPGLGLGLSIVKALVTAHGGTIEVHSATGKGAEFLFQLPFQP